MAKERLDILLTDEFDLKIQGGDFVVEDTTLQNQNLLILASKGEFKQSPTVGVGAIDFVLDEASAEDLEVAIQNEFEKDGLSIDSLQVSSDYTIKKEAYYNE